MNKLYDTIGVNYADLRRSDPRILARISAALGTSRTVLNVGAGAGSYEPADKQITAIDPSAEMILQRRASNSVAVLGCAEHLPFGNESFDASMAVLTIHHWSDRKKGVSEMRRVTKGNIVLFTFDPSCPWFWLVDYFPGLASLDDERMPTMTEYRDWLGSAEVLSVPIPHDCTDGFLAAYWRRPEAYLDERVRSAISSFWALGDISEGLRKLKADLESGRWEKRYTHLLNLKELDCGYRLVVARCASLK